MATKKDEKPVFLSLEIYAKRPCGHTVGSGFSGRVADRLELDANVDGLIKMIEQKYLEPCSICSEWKQQEERKYYVPGQD